MENTPAEQEAKKVGPSVGELVHLGELGFDAFKWFDAQGNEAIKTAARTLWLSNAGGLALIVGYAAKVEAMPQSAAIALILSTTAFIAGVILGVIPHVSIAHRTIAYQVFVGELAYDVLTKKKTEADIQAEFFQLLAKWRDKKGVVTVYLVRAKWCLVAGGVFGVLALGMKFLPPFTQ